MQLLHLLRRLSPVPTEWLENANGKPPEPTTPAVEPLPCTSYQELVEAWDDRPDKPGALYWNKTIDTAFSAMLAVIVSTPLKGAQVWLRVLGPPGSAKSSLCDAICACKDHVFMMSMLTGLHSGQGGNDIFQMIDGMTVVINEGDMLVNAPNRDATLAQIRDSWGGTVNAHYRNGVKYSRAAMRTTYIIAGTNTLRKLNRSAAGDRFLDVVIHEKKDRGAVDPLEHKMLNRVAEMELECYRQDEGKGLVQDSEEKEVALRKTVGFVQYLRAEGPKLVSKVKVPPTLSKDCVQLAQLVALMRARPDDKTEVEETEVELATRLTRQFIRTAVCLSVVMGTEINEDIMRRTATLAHHTSRGPTYAICNALFDNMLDATGLAARLGYSADKTRHYLSVLLAVGAVRADKSTAASGATGRNKSVYRLSPQTLGLLTRVRSMLGRQ